MRSMVEGALRAARRLNDSPLRHPLARLPGPREWGGTKKELSYRPRFVP
jgi:hypothetical protein